MVLFEVGEGAGDHDSLVLARGGGAVGRHAGPSVERPDVGEGHAGGREGGLIPPAGIGAPPRPRSGRSRTSFQFGCGVVKRGGGGGRWWGAWNCRRHVAGSRLGHDSRGSAVCAFLRPLRGRVRSMKIITTGCASPARGAGCAAPAATLLRPSGPTLASPGGECGEGRADSVGCLGVRGD